VTQNLLLATGSSRQILYESARRDVIHPTAESDRTLVDMATGCHDDELDAVSSARCHQRRQRRRPVANGDSGRPLSVPNVFPEVFLNACDETMTSLSPLPSPEELAILSHLPLTGPGCTFVAS